MRPVLLLPALLAACAAPGEPELARGAGVTYVATGDAARPRLRYPDGQLSRNDSCLVRIGNKLNYKVPPLYVNGAPVGFC